MDFIWFLEAELDKFNWFFVDKEGGYIIRSKELQDRVAKTKKSSNDEDLNMKAIKDVLDFHGEMVLLENYSALNYTDLLNDLRKDCEMMLNHLFSMTEPSVTSKEVHNENAICATRPITTSAGKESVIEGGGKRTHRNQIHRELILEEHLISIESSEGDTK
ncbi:hypothetical protein MKX01_034443 [Papaver californicum]|nr:hypothetical protein MKX01_034443 [Papaver californicum]